MKYFTFSFFFIVLLANLNAKEIHVPKDYSTIQAAIDAANDGDIVIVARGTYYENISFIGKKIMVTSNFYTTKDRADIELTIINGSKPSDTKKASCVSFNHKETSEAIINGFTITGGKGTVTANEGTFFRTGGGILINEASPVVSNNIIRNNHCTSLSGGVSGAGGGGIRMGYGSPTIINNIIKQNKGGYAGGIMIAYCGNAIIKNNVIAENIAGGAFNGGGGVYVDWERVTLINNTIINNESGDKGGGIISTGTLTKLINCIVWGNKAPNGSEQLMKRFGGRAKFIYSCVEDGYSGIHEEMITDNPLIADTTNYYLSPNSPCIDKGKDDAEYNDIESNAANKALFPSLGTTRNDMGAYGGSIVTELAVGIEDATFFSDISFKYSNPYQNDGINILSNVNAELQMSVYDMSGKLMRASQNISILQGRFTVPFMVNNSCIVVFSDDEGNTKAIKVIVH